MKPPANPSWNRRASLDVKLRKPLNCLAFTLLMVGLMSCGGGGGGGGPTAPGPVVPSVAGTWIGTWEVTSFTTLSSLQQKQIVTFDVSMTVSQTGNQVTGQITFSGPGEPISGPVEGTVSSAGVFSFRGGAPEVCDPINSELTLSPDSQRLEGNAVVDGSSCPEAEDRVRFTGPMSLQRQ